MFCIKCGFELKPEDHICPKCGTLNGVQTNPPATIQYKPIPNTTEKPKRRKLNLLSLFCVIFAVFSLLSYREFACANALISILLAFFALYQLKRNNEKGKSAAYIGMIISFASFALGVYQIFDKKAKVAQQIAKRAETREWLSEIIPSLGGFFEGIGTILSSVGGIFGGILSIFGL